MLASLCVSSTTLAAILEGLSPCSRAWWAQKRSSPPTGAPHGGRPGLRNGRNGPQRSTRQRRGNCSGHIGLISLSRCLAQRNGRVQNSPGPGPRVAGHVIQSWSVVLRSSIRRNSILGWVSRPGNEFDALVEDFRLRIHTSGPGSCPHRDDTHGSPSCYRDRRPAPDDPAVLTGLDRRAFVAVRRVAGRFERRDQIATARPQEPHDRTTRTTPPTSSSSRGSRRCASGPACTSAPPTPAGSCTASGRSSTTASTRRWPAPRTGSRSTLHPDGSAEVHDDGRGIPTDKEPKTGLPGVEVVATKLHAGGKFGGGSYVATGGLHGVGPLGRQRALGADGHRRRPLAVASRASASGAARPGVFAGDGPTAAFSAEVRADPQGRPGRQGQVRHPDPVLAGPPDLHQGRRVRVRGPARPGPADVVHRPRPRAGDPRPARRHARGGEVPPRRRHRGVRRVPRATTSRSPRSSGCRAADTFTETVPLLDDKGHMTPQEVERELPSTSRCGGAPATTPSCAPSST